MESSLCTIQTHNERLEITLTELLLIKIQSDSRPMYLIATPYKLLKMGKRIQGNQFFIYSNNPLTAVQQHSGGCLFVLKILFHVLLL